MVSFYNLAVDLPDTLSLNQALQAKKNVNLFLILFFHFKDFFIREVGVVEKEGFYSWAYWIFYSIIQTALYAC